MLLGHIAVGLSGKKYAPHISLATLVFAAELPDMVWVILSLLGIEHFRIVPGYTLMSAYDMYDTPFSHGLLANIVVAILFAAVYFLLKKNRRSSVILGFMLLSHWVLDCIAHRPDMVLITTAWPRVGLTLWNSFWGTIIVEIGLFIVGLSLYCNATKKRNLLASLPFVLFILFSLALYISSLFVTQPDSIHAGCFASGSIFILLVIHAGWTDALREVKHSHISPSDHSDPK